MSKEYSHYTLLIIVILFYLINNIQNIMLTNDTLQSLFLFKLLKKE